MTRSKFEKGMRVKVAHPNAPRKLKDRIGTVRAKQPYEGYAVEFDDQPGAIENVGSNWLELLTLNRAKRRALEALPRDLEKRRSPRYQADCFVAIEFQNHRFIGRCVDYSDQGFGAIVDCKLPLGWILTVELPLTGRKPLRIQARPVHEKDSRYGFEFLFPDGNRRALIADFFAEHLEDNR
jgi:hypothetical protein